MPHVDSDTSSGSTASFDETICQDAIVANLDMDQVRTFLQGDRVHLQSNDRADYTEQHMEALGLVLGEHPSYGALLCFGQCPSEQSKLIAGAYTRCVSWKDTTNDSEQLDAKECRGGLLLQFAEARAFLQKHLNFGRLIERGGSSEQPEFPFGVLEEALANALIHREYVSEPEHMPRAEGVMVEIFRDRVEIRSPGRPLVNVTALQNADERHPESRARNPQIMRIFYLAGDVDSKGTGIARMRQRMQDAGLPEPGMELNEQTRTFAVTLYRQAVTEPENDEAAIGPGFSMLSGARKVKNSSTLHFVENIAPRGLSRIHSFVQTILSLVLSVALIVGLGIGAAIVIPRWYVSTFVPASTTIEIASDFPTSGVNTTAGLPLQNGVQMAIDDANNAHVLPGYTFKLTPYNDVGRGNQRDPVVGVSNVNKAIADRLVAGIVGPYNSVVAEAEQPIANQAPIALISPSNTYPCLTKNVSTDPDCSGASNIVAQMRPTGQITYFRLATTDDYEGKAAADYFFTVQHHHMVLLLKDDSDPYSSGLAQAFQQEGERLGGRVVPLAVPENTSSFSEYQTTLQTAASLQPDLVYFAGNNPYGTYAFRALASIPQLKGVVFAGGDGIVDSDFLQVAVQLHRDAPVYFSLSIQDPAHSGQAVGINFERNYIKYIAKHYGNYVKGYNDYRPYAASAYACTMMLILAIKTAIQKGTSTPHGTQDQAGARQFRLAILQVLAHLRYTGPTGAQSFDANGDTTNHTITFYLLDLFNGQADWKWLQQVSDEETSATSFAMRCNRPRAFFCSMMS